jgi:hypothetical protein
MKVLLIIIFLLPLTIHAQKQMETTLDLAYQNAKKGVYWALANIPENKSRIQSDLIAEERLYASVKLEKEFNGVKIVSTGFCNSTQISITLYRSTDGMIRDGYIKLPGEEEKKK